MNKVVFMIFCICWISNLAAQDSADPDPEQIMADTKAKYRSIPDFSAELKIQINVDFIHIPDKTAHIIFRYPDRIKIKSKSFIMLPKRGIGFVIFELLESEHSVLYAGTRKFQGRDLDAVKIIPLEDKSDLVLATLYISRVDHLIYKLEATTRDAGFFTTTFEYGEHAPLPEINRIRFEVDKLKIPLKFLGKVDIDPSEMNAGTEGEVILEFDYLTFDQPEYDDSDSEYIDLN